MKRLLLFCAAICVLLICYSCGSDTSLSKLSPEAQIMADNFQVKNIVQHESLDGLLESCATEDIRSAYEVFPSDRFENVNYFNAYYTWDEELEFPISIAAFDYSGNTFYFAGAQQHNPFIPGFSSYTRYEIYAAKDVASVKVTSDGTIRSGDLAYYGHDAGYALALIDGTVRKIEYLDVLAAIVGSEFKCVLNDQVSMEGSTVYVDYKFEGECSGVTYTLSNPDVLTEVSFSYKEGSEPEIVNYSDDPDAPGADMIFEPNRVNIEFEAAGDGQTVLDIYNNDNDEVIYSVTIEVDGGFAFLP